MAVITKEILEIFANCLSAVESGGQVYGTGRWNDVTLQYTNSDNEHAITIGAYQRMGVEAKALLVRIQSGFPAQFQAYDNAGIGADLDASDWGRYQLKSKTCDKAKAIANIIGCSVGIYVQKVMMGEDIQKYADWIEQKYGIHRIDALLHLVNVRHLGGIRPLERIIGRISGEVTLEKVRDSLLKDTARNQVGAEPYKSRQALMYKWLHEKVTPLLNTNGLVGTEENDNDKGDEVTMISNSGHDENGRYANGQAGDQTGGEWSIINWYNRPWTCVLRHPDANVREKIAELGEKAARNNLVGYDQNQRGTYWQHLKASNYDPSQITIACEADCSAGVIANVKAVGYLLGINALKNVSASYTGNMRSGFRNAGFEVLTASKYLTSSEYLLRGDILLNDSHHTATNLTNGSKSGSGSSGAGSVSKGYLSKGDAGSEVTDMQTKLIACGFICGSAGADGDFGNGTDSGLREFQKAYGLEVDGCYGPKSKAKLEEVYAAKTSPAKKNVDEIAKEVIAGKWSSGDERKKKLASAGYDYTAVQKRVNEILSGAAKKSVTDIAKEIIAGWWGNGTERKAKIEAAGYSYSEVQNKVNELLK